ncbi:hypothetical protein QY76_13505 [Edwardsiella sp. EA181011]|nr:hypothetical protein QY76_13505 [Edwardsiella sp. EA181011]
MHGVVFELGDREVVINGQNSNEMVAIKGYQGVCGLTHMPEEDWNAIAKKYVGMTAISEEFIFAEKDEASAKAASEEVKELKTGLEQAKVKEDETEKVA